MTELTKHQCDCCGAVELEDVWKIASDLKFCQDCWEDGELVQQCFSSYLLARKEAEVE